MKKIKVDEIKGFVVPNEDLITRLENTIFNERHNKDEDYSVCERLRFDFDGINYALIEVYEDSISDEGKYQYGGEIYQLVEFDKAIASYPCEKSITKKFNLFVRENWSRSGSYFSDYYYEYEEPSLFSYEVTIVPEVVIPEHEEVVVKTIG